MFPTTLVLEQDDRYYMGQLKEIYEIGVVDKIEGQVCLRGRELVGSKSVGERWNYVQIIGMGIYCKDENEKRDIQGDGNQDY